MDVVVMESQAFQKLLESLEEIKRELKQLKESSPLEEVWMDNQQVCELLFISKRTLQNHRDTGKIKFSQIGAKIYYKASDIDTFLESHYPNKN